MKIILLCSPSLDTFQQEVLKPILADPAIETVGALIDVRPRPSIKQRFVKNLKRGRGGYMLVMLDKSRRAKGKPSVAAKDFFESHHVNTLETTSPYANSIVQELKNLQADTMVMLGGFGIVKEPLLSLTPRGILSYHHGDMRKYRGQPVALWELYNGEKEMGVTVQRLAAGIDKGMPIVEKAVAIERKDTVTTLRERAMAASTSMMHQALQKIQAPDFQPSPLPHYGPIYTIPNLRQYLILQLKLHFRR